MNKLLSKINILWFTLGLIAGICLTILFLLFWIQILTAIIVFVVIIVVIMWISPKVREIILAQLKIPVKKHKEKPKHKVSVRTPCQFCGSKGKHKKTCKLAKQNIKENKQPETPKQD
jgi:hypothetical protein